MDIQNSTDNFMRKNGKGQRQGTEWNRTTLPSKEGPWRGALQHPEAGPAAPVKPQATQPQLTAGGDFMRDPESEQPS